MYTIVTGVQQRVKKGGIEIALYSSSSSANCGGPPGTEQPVGVLHTYPLRSDLLDVRDIMFEKKKNTRGTAKDEANWWLAEWQTWHVRSSAQPTDGR